MAITESVVMETPHNTNVGESNGKIPSGVVRVSNCDEVQISTAPCTEVVFQELPVVPFDGSR